MNKRNIISSIILGSFLLLFIGGGFVLFNKNGKKQQEKMVSLADEYIENNEFDKALGIIEALIADDKENPELLSLIKSIKEKEALYSTMLLEKRLEAEEQELNSKIDSLVNNVVEALTQNQLRVAEILLDEIERLDPANQVASELRNKLYNKEETAKDNLDNIVNLSDEVKNAIRSRNPVLIQDLFEEFSKNIEETLNEDSLDDIEKLENELRELEPGNSSLRTTPTSIERSQNNSEEILNNLNDLESDIKKALMSDEELLLENRVKDAKESEALTIRAQDLFKENKLEEAEALLYDAIKLDPENSRATELLEIVKNEIAETENRLDSDSLVDKALLEIDKDDLLEAKRFVEKAIELDPSNTNATKLLDLINKELEKESSQRDSESLNKEQAAEQAAAEQAAAEQAAAEQAAAEQAAAEQAAEQAAAEQAAAEQAAEQLISIDDLIDQAKEYELASQFEKQIEVLNQILDREPTAAFYVEAGIASYKLTLYDQGITYFNKAIEADENYPGIYYPLALSYEKIAKPKEQEAMLNKGLELRPDHGATNYELGRFYTSTERYSEALELFLNAQSIDNQSIKYKLGVALAYYNLEEYDKAINIYENINKISDDISEVYYNLSMARSKVGQNDQALKDIKKAIKLKPGVPSYLYTIGEISESLGNIEDAANYYLESLKLNIEYYKPMLNLGNIYDKLGRYQDSVTLLEKALSLEPDDPNAKFSLGTAYLHNKEYGKAITLLKESHDNDPESTVKLYTLALAYTEIGDNKAAENSFLTVIKRDSNYYDAYFYLGQLLYSADRIEEAKSYFDKLLELNPDYKFKDQILELP